MNYRLAYRIGFHPWEDAQHQQPFINSLSRLLDQVEHGDPPYGPALDIGTGSGIWAIELARRGWDVTGIDIAETALNRAHNRIQAQQLPIRLVHADATDLDTTQIGSGYRLILDTGTFHGLTQSQQHAMGRQVSAVAADNATILMLAWKRRRRGPLPRGANPRQINEAFPAWHLQDAGPTGFQAPQPIERLLQPDEHWYQLKAERRYRGCAAGFPL